MIEKELNNDFRARLVFFSVPICSIATLIRFQDFYLMLGQCLLLLVLCEISLMFLYNRSDVEVKYSPYINSVGFIFVTVSSIIADVEHFNWVFMIGIVILAVYSEMNYTLMSILTYSGLISILAIGTTEYKVLSLLVSVGVVILIKYFSDKKSLFYVLTTVISLVIMLYLVLGGLRIYNLFTQARIIDLGIITLSVLFAYALYVNRPLQSKEEGIEIGESDLIQDDVAKNKEFSGEEKKKEGIEGVFLNEEEKETVEFVVNTDSMKEENDGAKEHKAGQVETNVEEGFSYEDYSYLLTENTFLYSLIKSKTDLYIKCRLRAKICGEIAEMIGANGSLTAAGAFYCESGKLVSNNYLKESLKLMQKYQLPKEVLQIVKEHHFKIGKPSSKEASIVLIENKVDSYLSFMKSIGKQFPPTHIIDSVTDTILMSGKLDKSGLSLSDYKFIKDYLIEEAPKNYDYFN